MFRYQYLQENTPSHHGNGRSFTTLSCRDRNKINSLQFLLMPMALQGRDVESIKVVFSTLGQVWACFLLGPC